MYCPNCKQNFDGKFCPECGTKLIEEPQATGVNLNLGDGNAISGGINMDSHNVVNNIDNSVHNITNNTSNIHNITNIAAQKSDLEILQERLDIYRKQCEGLCVNGTYSNDAMRQLDTLRATLGLGIVECDAVRENIQKLKFHQSKATLTTENEAFLDQVEQDLQYGEIDKLLSILPRLEALAEVYDAEKVQYYYYLLLAGFNPYKCVRLYENRKNENYWQSYWTSCAYLCTDDKSKAEMAMMRIENWPDKENGNLNLLKAAIALYDFSNNLYNNQHIELAEEALSGSIGNRERVLDSFYDTLSELSYGYDWHPGRSKPRPGTRSFSFFYCHYLLGEVTHKILDTCFVISRKIMSKEDFDRNYFGQSRVIFNEKFWMLGNSMEAKNDDAIIITDFSNAIFNGKKYENIKELDFSQCTKLTEIGAEVFLKCSAEIIKLPGSIREIGAGAFRESKIKQIKLPAGLKSIPEYCFEECTNLSEIELCGGENDKSLGICRYAFYRCCNLEYFTGERDTYEIIDTDSLTVDDNTYTGCNKLKSYPKNTLRETFQSI